MPAQRSRQNHGWPTTQQAPVPRGHDAGDVIALLHPPATLAVQYRHGDFEGHQLNSCTAIGAALRPSPLLPMIGSVGNARLRRLPTFALRLYSYTPQLGWSSMRWEKSCTHRRLCLYQYRAVHTAAEAEVNRIYQYSITSQTIDALTLTRLGEDVTKGLTICKVFNDIKGMKRFNAGTPP